MSTPIRPGSDSYVPVMGVHDADGNSEIRMSTDKEIAVLTYDPDTDEPEYDIQHEVDRRITPGTSPGPNIPTP